MNSIFRLLLLSTLLVAVASTLAAPIKPPTEPVAGFERDFEINPRVVMRFCWIPSGQVQLGLTKAQFDGYIESSKDEKWIARVSRLKEDARGKYQSKGFWLGKYEVTQAQYRLVMGKNPSANTSEKGGDTSQYPVESVSWDDCQAFIKKCHLKGFKIKLPHEDEWEYAYWGGKGNASCYYWGNSLNGDYANCDGRFPFGTTTKGKDPIGTTPVGSYEKKAKHPWGLCDMSGNVNEWCDNVDPSDAVRRAQKGGAWDSSAKGCMGAITGYECHYVPWPYDGFRVMLVPE